MQNIIQLYMKKINLHVVFFVLFLFSLNNLFGQSPTEKYGYIILKGDIVKNTLSNYQNFALFDFTYQLVEDDVYILSGYAKNESGEQLGGLITLDLITTHAARKLKNLDKGHLFLDLSTMELNNVDGSEDYILSPKKCKDRNGNELDYVSYFFSNKINTSISLLLNTTVKNFTLNPSPPY